jgi:hypothetical protein
MFRDMTSRRRTSPLRIGWFILYQREKSSILPEDMGSIREKPRKEGTMTVTPEQMEREARECMLGGFH